jgi:hypothetical protein
MRRRECEKVRRDVQATTRVLRVPEGLRGGWRMELGGVEGKGPKGAGSGLSAALRVPKCQVLLGDEASGRRGQARRMPCLFGGAFAGLRGLWGGETF